MQLLLAKRKLVAVTKKLQPPQLQLRFQLQNNFLTLVKSKKPNTQVFGFFFILLIWEMYRMLCHEVINLII
jgi:hypothetical protein